MPGDVLERVFPADQLEFDDWEVDHWVHHTYAHDSGPHYWLAPPGCYGNRRGSYREVMAITCHVAVPVEEFCPDDPSVCPKSLPTMPGWVYAGRGAIGYDLVTMYETPGLGGDATALQHYYKTGEWWEPERYGG